MADLDQAKRDALPAEHFALPSERRLPINDVEHLKLAHAMLGRTKGLTPAQIAEAKTNIASRAKELGVDTSKWDTLGAGADPFLLEIEG